jgi:putative transposase
MPVKELDKITVAELFKEIKDEETLWGDLTETARLLLRRFLEGGMEQEIRNHLRCSTYERTKERLGWRNGYYQRFLETSFGALSLSVPRDRDGLFRTSLFERYKRRKAEVERFIRELFLSGVATRRVGDVMEVLLGYRISSQTVSRISKSLDEEVARFHSRPLEDKYVYLFLDGITLKVKGTLCARKRPVLVAYGIARDGKKEIIDFRQAPSESEEAWASFLNDLYFRGLKGETLNLITTDGGTGLLGSLATLFPYVSLQRCWVHKLRNVSGYISKKKQEEVLKGAKAIYKAKNRREATASFREWKRTWQAQFPRAVACLEKDIDELLSFFSFPEAHRIKIRTTNIIERCFREVRRRTRPMTCFTNDRSCERIVYGVLSYLNTKWERKPLKEITQNS